MIDTNAPFPSPEDIELDAFYKAQDELIQEMRDRGELGEPTCVYDMPIEFLKDEPMILPKHLKPRAKLIGRNFKEHKESLLKRLFSFLFR
jgi:predicted RNA methylase